MKSPELNNASLQNKVAILTHRYVGHIRQCSDKSETENLKTI